MDMGMRMRMSLQMCIVATGYIDTYNAHAKDEVIHEAQNNGTVRAVLAPGCWWPCMGVSWPAVEAALRTDPQRLPPALLADVQQHLEGLVFGLASQQPLNLSWSPPHFECAATAYTIPRRIRCTGSACTPAAVLRTACVLMRDQFLPQV